MEPRKINNGSMFWGLISNIVSLALIVADHFVDWVVHVMGVLTAGGGSKKSVLEQSAGEGYGREKVRIFTLIHSRRSFDLIYMQQVYHFTGQK